MSSRYFTRRTFLGGAAAGLAAGIAGCADRQDGSSGELERVWGRRGFADGRFQRPRAIAIDAEDQLYIVDMTGRIQVFTVDGEWLRSWRTPAIDQGKPTGMSFDNDGHLMVADTHYFRILFYTRQGDLLEERTIGGTHGFGPGEFNFVTDVVQDPAGNYYVSEYGEYDRIQKFSASREFLFEWGGHGSAEGKFMRPQSLVLDEQQQLWVSDACNHRIQVFDATGTKPRLVQVWGRQGARPGELRYPYGLLLEGEFVYTCEFGNHRVQKFTRGGELVGWWGRGGHRPGELNQPWAVAADSRGRLHVLDSYNHRVQRIRL